MRSVILTRPLPCSNQLPLQLAQAGLQVLQLPTLHLSALHSTEHEQHILNDWPRYTVAMFVSQHSAEFAHQHMTRLGLHWPSEIWLSAVGQGTSAMLKNLWPTHTRWIQPQAQDSQDSEGLWRAFASHPQLQEPQHLLIIRAEQGRNALLQWAQNAHWTTSIWPCYRREPRHWTALEMHQFNQACAHRTLIVATSIEGLNALTAQLSPEQARLLPQQRLVTIHPRIAEFAQSAGFSDAHLCAPDQLATRLPILAAETNP